MITTEDPITAETNYKDQPFDSKCKGTLHVFLSVTDALFPIDSIWSH